VIPVAQAAQVSRSVSFWAGHCSAGSDRWRRSNRAAATDLSPTTPTVDSGLFS
jgi:hypothetical protein